MPAICEIDFLVFYVENQCCVYLFCFFKTAVDGLQKPRRKKQKSSALTLIAFFSSDVYSSTFCLKKNTHFNKAKHMMCQLTSQIVATSLQVLSRLANCNLLCGGAPGEWGTRPLDTGCFVTVRVSELSSEGWPLPWLPVVSDFVRNLSRQNF